MDKIRWGILGCGSISRKFAAGLAVAEGCELYACAARSIEGAEQFVSELGEGKAVEGYEALFEDEQVDAIYIGTPHVFHLPQAKAALQAGKAVLCEKPICTSAAQTRELVNEAEKQGVFLMEAMWTRFFPLMAKVRELVADGVIGEVRVVEADFGFRCGGDPEHRLMNPELAGGSLLDVGIYPLSFAHMLLGQPVSLKGVAHLGETQVDEQAAWVALYDGGAMAIGQSAVRTKTHQEAKIYGTEGMIHIASPWWSPRSFTLHVNGQASQAFEFQVKANGYEYEAEAVAQCLKEGLKEHPLMPWATSIELQESMDDLREQFGLVYPWEQDVKEGAVV